MPVNQRGHERQGIPVANFRRDVERALPSHAAHRRRRETRRHAVEREGQAADVVLGIVSRARERKRQAVVGTEFVIKRERHRRASPQQKTIAVNETRKVGPIRSRVGKGAVISHGVGAAPRVPERIARTVGRRSRARDREAKASVDGNDVGKLNPGQHLPRGLLARSNARVEIPGIVPHRHVGTESEERFRALKGGARDKVNRSRKCRPRRFRRRRVDHLHSRHTVQRNVFERHATIGAALVPIRHPKAAEGHRRVIKSHATQRNLPRITGQIVHRNARQILQEFTDVALGRRSKFVRRHHGFQVGGKALLVDRDGCALHLPRLRDHVLGQLNRSGSFFSRGGCVHIRGESDIVLHGAAGRHRHQRRLHCHAGKERADLHRTCGELRKPKITGGLRKRFLHRALDRHAGVF